jgi:hypothetical protein
MWEEKRIECKDADVVCKFLTAVDFSSVFLTVNLIYDPFETAPLHEIQPSFTNFTIDQPNLKVARVGGSIWLAAQL